MRSYDRCVFLVDQMVERRALCTVYKGRLIGTGETVAIKVLTERSPKLKFYFDQEVDSILQLQPLASTPRLFHSDTLTPYLYHVCSWAQGRPLSKMIACGSGYKISRLAQIIEALAWSIEAIHLAGYCHRDISPEHVLLRKDGSISIVDYGMARAFSSLGTHEARSFAGYDVQAVGMIFCELLLSQRIFSYRKSNLRKEICAVLESFLESSILPLSLQTLLITLLTAPSEFYNPGAIAPIASASDMVSCLRQYRKQVQMQ